MADPLTKQGYELEFEDRFDTAQLDRKRWLPAYLPQWSSRDQAAARYALGDGTLRLRVEADQPPWCPEFDGDVRVSSLQTGVFAGPLGSDIGQHRFTPAAVVREEQQNRRLYTPREGVIEVRARALVDPHTMVALWMIGYEDAPERSAEICVCEIFGSEVRPGRALVGMGVHPFGDPRITDDFEKIEIAVDVREFHVYTAEWTSDHVAFFVDGEPRKLVWQSPDYPMQLMLGIYEFGGVHAGEVYPKEFVVDYVRGYRAATEGAGGRQEP
ncbi:MAG: glycoside hydrolase family 16 protein [Kineosporiaceae bacterium]